MRKGEIRAGGGTGAVEGSLGEERNESVKSRDRVGMCLNSRDRVGMCLNRMLL